jgi:hypothetical protein
MLTTTDPAACSPAEGRPDVYSVTDVWTSCSFYCGPDRGGRTCGSREGTARNHELLASAGASAGEIWGSR